jgi:hypothetical protein
MLNPQPDSRGLDPAIHRGEKLSFLMDARVKPAHGGIRDTRAMADGGCLKIEPN